MMKIKRYETRKEKQIELGDDRWRNYFSLGEDKSEAALPDVVCIEWNDPCLRQSIINQAGEPELPKKAKKAQRGRYGKDG